MRYISIWNREISICKEIEIFLILKEISLFLIEISLFLIEISIFLIEISIFLIEISLFLIEISLFSIEINRIYHDFVQWQGNPPECQRFAVHDEACRVVEVAFLPLETDLYPKFARLGKCFLTLETGISANFDVRRNVVPPWRVRQAHSGSNSPMTSQNVNAKQSRKVASSGRFRHILHIFGQEWEK